LRKTVVNEVTRAPIPEGTVFLGNGVYSASYAVGAGGRFEIPSLLPGAYTLEVRIFGHSHVRQTIVIDGEDLILQVSAQRLY
jgi:hypothetical protein